MLNYHRERFRKLSKSFTVVIQHLSTRLIKPNFCFDLPHRRSTTVSLETRNPVIPTLTKLILDKQTLLKTFHLKHKKILVLGF